MKALFLNTLLGMIALSFMSACSSTPKTTAAAETKATTPAPEVTAKTETKAPEKMAAPTASAPSKKSSKSKAKVAKASAAPTAPATPSEKTTAGSEGQGKVTCKSGSEVRTLEVKAGGQKACEVLYTKSGESKSIASAISDTAFCNNVTQKVSKNLQAAGYKCE
ncbi:MAG: hypothetical protein J0M15_06250 [Deltaproteobacteria bacterium]|jgi:hypothetical protein|nr:hypothetical protein [Deltaproteobacteria bacterium]